MLPLSILAGALALLGVVTSARALEADHWRRSLHAYRLTLPKSIDDEQLLVWFRSLAAITHRPNWSLLPLPPIGLETVAARAGIAHVLLVAEANRPAVLTSLQAAVQGVRVTELHNYQRPKMVHALELTLTNRSRPLAHDRAAGTAAALLSSLQPLPSSAAVVVQCLLTSAGTPPPVKQPPAASRAQPLPWLVEGEAPVDAEAVGQLRKKYAEPLLHAVVRVGVTGADQPVARALAGRSWSAFQTLNAPGVRLVRRYLPSLVVARRLQGPTLPWLRWPLLVNAAEMVGLSALPTGPLYLPGLRLGAARQLPTPESLPRRGLVLAESNYPTQQGRPLAVSTRDRLRHSYIVGPTGSGKSWLLANCILQDIRAGYGVCAVDVKGDLVADILARLRPEDEPRVTVISPADRAWPVGLNVLQHDGSEAARELVVDNVLHIFRELWRASWGPRTEYVMRGGLRTLTLATAPNDQPLTLIELTPLLTNPAFRRRLVEASHLPADLRAFWQRYDAMSEPERAQVIGPALNKLDAFTSRTPTRLMFGQSLGVDLTDIFRKRQVVLVALDKGQLGAETANLLGALTVASLWQAALTRSRIPSQQRRPCFAYLDEAQDIVRLPLAIADMLAQARGYGLGLTLANQYVAQLPEAVRTAILGTTRTQVAFQVDYDDARLLERRFAPLTSDDLQGLAAFEIALRPSVGGQTLTPVTGQTLPLPDALQEAATVAARLARRGGRERAAIEAEMQARLGTEPTSPNAQFGRQDLGDQA